MLRADLRSLDALLGDALLLDEEEFRAVHLWPIFVFTDLDQPTLRRLSRPEALSPTAPMPALYRLLEPGPDPREPSLCLPVRPLDSDAEDRITLGRSHDADVVLLDDTISTMHAEVSWTAATQRCVLTDLGSKNGTWVDDERLPGRGHADLEPGATVAFGTLTCRYFPPLAFRAWLVASAK